MCRQIVKLLLSAKWSIFKGDVFHTKKVLHVHTHLVSPPPCTYMVTWPCVSNLTFFFTYGDMDGIIILMDWHWLVHRRKMWQRIYKEFFWGFGSFSFVGAHFNPYPLPWQKKNLALYKEKKGLIMFKLN